MCFLPNWHLGETLVYHVLFTLLLNLCLNLSLEVEVEVEGTEVEVEAEVERLLTLALASTLDLRVFSWPIIKVGSGKPRMLYHQR